MSSNRVEELLPCVSLVIEQELYRLLGIKDFDATLIARAVVTAISPDGVEEALRTASDLLAERIYGNTARSPAHNARVVMESALAKLSAGRRNYLAEDCDELDRRAAISAEGDE